jgi:hypothetical protein
MAANTTRQLTTFKSSIVVDLRRQWAESVELMGNRLYERRTSIASKTSYFDDKQRCDHDIYRSERWFGALPRL